MTNVGGHFCSHIGTVSQAAPAAMSQVHRRHMRTRLNVRSNLRRYTNLIQTYLIPPATQRRPPHADTSHGTHHTEAIWVSGSTKNKEQQFARNESGRMLTVHSPVFFRKIVDIERFALRATILDDCQIYLRGGGQSTSSLVCLNPDALPLGTYKTKMATCTGKRPILTIFTEKRGV